MAVMDRFKKVWNAFRSDESSISNTYDRGPSTYAPPDRPRRRSYNDRTIVTSLYNRMAVDVAGIDIRHVNLDDKKRYLSDRDSKLNDCLQIEPNLDQYPRGFKQNIAMTLFESGVAAIVPVDALVNPKNVLDFDIATMRVGDIVQYHPNHVKVSLYNEKTGTRQDVTLEKRFVAIVENPLYAVMNEPNSTLQRLIRKLAILDAIDEQSGSGKLDLIIQLPYTVKTEAMRKRADDRRKDIEFQLKGSQYGIAYADGTEKITQLNRPAENNLLKQIEMLVDMLYGQLGITPTVMNGTADEATMINYYNRSIEPIIEGVIEAMRKSFLGVDKIHAKQDIMYFRNPFAFVSLKDFAELSDKLARNEILTSNELRQAIGFVPSSDPKADELRNSNMPLPEPEAQDDESTDL